MKYMIISALIAFTACSGNNSQLEGIYTTHFEHEYGSNDDTLIVERINEQGIFQVIRHNGLVRIFHAKVFPKELKTDTWNLVYDDSKNILTDLEGERVIVWDKKRSALLIGKEVYQRVDGY